MIPIIQGYAAGSWLLVALYLSPTIWHVIQGSKNPSDIFGLLWVTIATIQIGFSARWHIFPVVIQFMGETEKITWMGLYLSSGITANLVTFYAAYHHHNRRKLK